MDTEGDVMSLLAPDVDLLRVKEVAALFRVSTMTIFRLVDSGELKAIRVGNSIRIPRAEVERFIEANTTAVA